MTAYIVYAQIQPCLKLSLCTTFWVGFISSNFTYFQCGKVVQKDQNSKNNLIQRPPRLGLWDLTEIWDQIFGVISNHSPSQLLKSCCLSCKICGIHALFYGFNIPCLCCCCRPTWSTPAAWQQEPRVASRSANTSLHGTAGTAPRELCSCPHTAACAAVRPHTPAQASQGEDFQRCF